MTTQTTEPFFDRIDYYACFTASEIFEDLLNAIPDPKVKKAIEENGIGDDLTRSDFGWIYDYESGGLLEKPVQDALDALDDALDQERDGEWDQNYHSICSIAEAYAAYANALQTAE